MINIIVNDYLLDIAGKEYPSYSGLYQP